MTSAEPANAGLFPRYRDRIPDWEQFADACSRPAPVTIRTNTLRAETDELMHRLESVGVRVETIDWSRSLVRVDRPVGRTLEHWLGHFYIQEVNQTLPVVALDPQPDETVLDLCAAPGGKTTQISARMENRGILIANEPSGRRQQALLANVNRLGTLNATITEYRGESFPMTALFDRILVDAPCSAEGTVRRETALRGGATPATIRRLPRLQKRLLARAYGLLRPGGVLVYSTCTFAPEENEAVVADLLASSDAKLAPAGLPVDTEPGWTEWEGVQWPPALSRCARIYPHHLDSGGGFLARIARPTT